MLHKTLKAKLVLFVKEEELRFKHMSRYLYDNIFWFLYIEKTIKYEKIIKIKEKKNRKSKEKCISFVCCITPYMK